MWPLTLIPPRYPESLIVCLVDTYCSIRDYLNIKGELDCSSWYKDENENGQKTYDR